MEVHQLPTPLSGQKRKRIRRKKKVKKRKIEPPIKDIIKQEKVEEEGEKIEFEYISEPLLQEDDPNYEAFKKIFSCFAAPEELCMSREEKEKLQLQNEEKGEANEDASGKNNTNNNNNGDKKEQPTEEEEEAKAMSKREKKKQKRLSVAVLKQIVPRPEVVEVWDVTSSDPVLLVHLKSYRNTVPVPRHWCQKRKYLQGKRGIEKPPFELPDFIAATGISRIRQAIQEQEDQKKLKQKQREKMQPKMGKMDIDYQVLHDAFFKHQTKPRLSVIGDLYYEGKEFEVKLKEKRPGQLSDELKAALGMPEGAPPPWLINMQRYGPPPSYPNLKIPGLNAPIPVGAQFGYHPGGWGKPPVDQFGKPLYGDVFGIAMEQFSEVAEPIEKKHWGELEDEELESEEEEEEEEEEAEREGEEEQEEAHIPSAVARPPQPALDSGLETPTGIETPDHLVLRKKVDVAEEPRTLYKVLQQKETAVGSAAFGSSHAYVMGDEDAKEKKKKSKDAVNLIKSQKTKEVDITLNPAELENLTDAVLKEKYESTLASGEPEREDVSDLLAEHSKKARAKTSKDKKAKEKYKFKF